jgi:DNA-binding SARP family transcriptional activator
MARDTVSGRTRPALAKVTPPLIGQALSRKYLFDKLDSMRENQTIWISSPAGSGKTTLVSTYLEDRKIPCLWYQVDMADDDPATFFYYLGKAALNAVPKGEKEFPALTPEYLVSLPTFTMRFFEDLSNHLLSSNRKRKGKKNENSPGFVLVFDSCQEVPETSSFHNILLTGLARVPSEISVFLISRTSPPPAYARLQANYQMSLLGWDDLRLSHEESEQIIRMRYPQSVAQETIEHIYRITDGWSAGITLMLGELKQKGFHDLQPHGSTPEEIMYYFGSELFDRMDTTTRDFLMKTSFLPKMTVKMAKDLTGNQECSRILDSLYRNNYFIHKHFQAESSYEYHPLFREFLSKMAGKTLSDVELETVASTASAILDASGQPEAAMELLRKISGWDAMVPLITQNAPVLIEQGRYRTLQEWLAPIPDDVIDAHPWLMYWKGTSLQSSDPDSAKKTFEKTFERFSSEGDKNGMLFSLSGITESIQLLFSDFAQYEPWIPAIENLFRTGEEIPSKELEARLLDGMVTALVLCKPEHPEIGTWVNRAAALLEQSLPLTIKARLIHAVLFYYILQFDVPRMDLVYGHLKAIIKSNDIPPVTGLFMHLMEANYHVMKANHEECLAAVNDGLGLAREIDVHLMDHFFMCHAAMSCLNENNQQEAQGFLDTLTGNYDQMNPWEKKAYHQVKAREALILNDTNQAYFHASKTLDFILQLGFKVHIALGHYILSQALHVLGKHDEEVKNIKESLEATRMIEETTHGFYTTLLQSTCAFDRGDDSSGYEYLNEAFTYGNEHGHLGTYGDIPKETARLCARAIEAGIKPEYAKWLIRKRRLTLEPPPYHLEGWPWPVKIYTLGRFSILIDDTALTYSRKGQNKPLEVLKILVSGGGSNVADTYVADTLWPDAEGDLAMQALATNLHRLRKLLGRNDAVLLQNGMLALDKHLCWVDARAFEYCLNRADSLWENASTTGDYDEACSQICSAIDFYRGEFLPDEQWLPDVVPMREHLHAKFLKSLSRMGEHLVKTGQYDRARQAIECGLDIDSCAEDLYRLLMVCMHCQGLKAEALSVFERCKKTLQVELGTTPSKDTEALARSLRSEKSH